MNEETQSVLQIDEKLLILREGWMDAKPEKKSTWMAKIDAALDERIIATKPAKQKKQ